MIALRFTIGFAFGILPHVYRIACWAFVVLAIAAVIGLPPEKTLVMCILANVLGSVIYGRGE